MTLFAFGFFAPGPWELILVGLLCAMFAAVPAILVVVLLVNRNKSGGQAGRDERIQCPQCAEWIVWDAIKCRFCNAQISSDADPSEEEG